MYKKSFTLFLLVAAALPAVVFSETAEERKARLEKELQAIEMQMIQSQRLLDAKSGERQSIERDLSIIDAEIDRAQYGIQARDIAITELTDQIGEKEEVIEILEDRLVRQRDSVSDLIRKTQEFDDFSLVEVLLSKDTFSSFFEDFEKYRDVNASLKDSITALREIRFQTTGEVEDLERKQLSELELKEVQEAQKAEIEAREREKAQILNVTKGEEAVYQEMLASQQKSAAQLRAQLFELLGGGGAIPFPQAVSLAQNAGRATGVNPALILAILEQESAYGSNIGGCTMGDVSAGRDIMHPDRDKPVFLAMAPVLGFNAATQAVSCPLLRADGSRIGWGGAMGASQFIPSTWAMYGGFYNAGGSWQYDANRDTIRAVLGKSTPSNPFINQDAFTATGLLLRDNGANGTWGGDRLAALRYYAGWGGASNPENQFYGDQVAERKARLEQEIRTLGGG